MTKRNGSVFLQTLVICIVLSYIAVSLTKWALGRYVTSSSSYANANSYMKSSALAGTYISLMNPASSSIPCASSQNIQCESSGGINKYSFTMDNVSGLSVTDAGTDTDGGIISAITDLHGGITDGHGFVHITDPITPNPGTGTGTGTGTGNGGTVTPNPGTGGGIRPADPVIGGGTTIRPGTGGGNINLQPVADIR